MQVIDVRLFQTPRWFQYSVAVGTTLIAAVWRERMQGVMGESSPLVVFSFPVAIAAFLGGMGPGLVATALSLAAKDGSGWESLAEFAADETAQPYPDRPNTVCSPAGPEFNEQELDKLAEATKTDAGDWGFTSTDGVEVRATAAQNAPVIEKLGMQFVRVMPDTAPNASQDFMRIVAPSGKVGFVAAEAINPLGSDQLCYGKDASGAWKIVGMIGGG